MADVLDSAGMSARSMRFLDDKDHLATGDQALDFLMRTELFSPSSPSQANVRDYQSIVTAMTLLGSTNVPISANRVETGSHLRPLEEPALQGDWSASTRLGIILYLSPYSTLCAFARRLAKFWRNPYRVAVIGLECLSRQTRAFVDRRAAIALNSRLAFSLVGTNRDGEHNASDGEEAGQQRDYPHP
jgi:hypothetical protein